MVAAIFRLSAGLVAFCDLHAQVSPPSASEISPAVNTEVSSLIHTGCGYDAWTGSVRRSITDLEVPGAVSLLGLKWVRTYNSSGSGVLGWSFSWTWRYWGRGWGDEVGVRLPDGGIWRPTETGTKLRFWRSCNGGPNCLYGEAFLYLEDGSKVHMNFWVDPPDDYRNYPVDYFTPDYVDDPYGRRTTLEYEEACVFGNGNYIRLKQVTDPSGRFIRIRYACDATDCQSCTTSNWYKVTRVEGSDGSWVNYHYNGNDLGSYLTHVDYSDGSSADYTYDDTTYLYQNCCSYPDCNSQCWFTAHATKLITARDTHADSPMQSIKYEYNYNGWFEGQIRTEHHLASNVAVSTLTCDSQCPSRDRDSATQRETRGDGPSRTLYIEKGAQHVPLVKRKSDFNGINEVYTYNNNNYLLTARDRNGNLTTYTNEPVIGNPTQILHPDGTHIDYTYSDANNPYHIATVANERGKTTTYTRDANNRITRIDYPADANTPASYETFTYNGWGQVLTHRRRNGYYEHAAYYNRLLWKLWNPTATASYPPPDTEPHITLTYYTGSGGPSPTPHPWQDQVQTVTYPATGIGQVPSETYEYDRAFAGGVTDPNGAAVHGRGLVTKITHADNTYQLFGYDAYGNKRWEENELRKRTSYTYDDYKRLLTVTNPLIKTTRNDYSSTEGNSTQCYMHTTNSPYFVTTPAGIKTHNVYDGNFRKSSTTAAYGTSQPATTSFAYDNVGNLTDVTEPLAVTHNTYDTRNRKTSTSAAYGTNLAQTTQFYYDDGINLTRIIRPDLTTETKVYDALNRMLSDTVPQTNSVNLTTTFTYNPSGTVASVTVPQSATVNLTTSFAYDASDQKITMTYPNGGGTQSWAYDDVHNPKWRITVNNEAQYFYYDSRNRKYATWWINWANNIVDWCYFGYDEASRLTEAENGTGGWAQNVISDVHRFYDDANHLTLEQQNVTGLGMKSVNYPTYDDDGKLTSMNVTGEPEYNYTFSYDQMGRFENIFITNGPRLFQYYYDAASNERQRNNVYNGVQQIYPRDALNRMLYLDVKKGANTLGHEGYGYDAMNRLNSVARNQADNDSFTYYKDGELNTAQYQYNNRSVNYTLDRAGNRTSVVDNGTTKSYSPNRLNQYTTAESSSITNGPEHEIQAFNNLTYTYINDERLSSVSSTSPTNTYSLAYDALGRCVKRRLNSDSNITYYIYDGEKPILEYDTTGNRVGFNVYGKAIDEILERGAKGTDNQWHWYFFQQDHEGSVTHLTDASGNIIERYRYDAFGAPTIYAPNWIVRSATIYDNRFLFTGREYAATYRSTYNVPAFKFYEYRARAYNPTLGRFMSEDPKLFDAGDYNLYRYCHNDPLDMTDPMGTYGMGSGWNPWCWQQFNQAQQAAAQHVQSASEKIDRALADKAAADKAGKESKGFNSMSKAFEQTFGKGSGTAQNMAKVSQTYKQMVTALRDDGSKGYVANAMTAKEVAARGWDTYLFGRGTIGGKTI